MIIYLDPLFEHVHRFIAIVSVQEQLSILQLQIHYKTVMLCYVKYFVLKQLCMRGGVPQPDIYPKV